MKKILAVIALCLGLAYSANAQSDAALVSKFLDAVVQKDAVTLMEIVNSDTQSDVDKLLAQSEILQFTGWNFVYASNTEDGTRFIAAFNLGISPDEITEEQMDYERKRAIITPSGHIFGYEYLCVVEENGRKCIGCNADIPTIVDVEAALRKIGKYLPSKYYENCMDYR